jgi:hypothetical protein
LKERYLIKRPRPACTTDCAYILSILECKSNKLIALTAISIWFGSSGLKVNEDITEIAIFYKDNCNPEDVLLNGMSVRTKGTIKVLGVMMDTMLTWHEQINNTVANVQSEVHAIRMIQCFFLTDELLQLLKMYCYPSLYYALNVWLTSSLNKKLKSKLFSTLGKIISIIKVISYKDLHQFTRATPEIWQNYELEISLYNVNTAKTTFF